MAMAAGTQTLINEVIDDMKEAVDLVAEVAYIKGQPLRDLRDLCIQKFEAEFDKAVAAGEFAAWAFLPTYPSYTDTSTSSNSVALGAKTFTVTAGKAFAAGQTILIDSDADKTNYMKGKVTSYSSTTLIVNVTELGGSGTKTDWDITVLVAGKGGADDVTP